MDLIPLWVGLATGWLLCAVVWLLWWTQHDCAVYCYRAHVFTHNRHGELVHHVHDIIVDPEEVV